MSLDDSNKENVNPTNKESVSPSLKRKRDNDDSGLTTTPSGGPTNDRDATTTPTPTPTLRSGGITTLVDRDATTTPTTKGGTPTSPTSPASPGPTAEDDNVLMTPLINEHLESSITNYMKHYLNLKVASTELTASIKKHLLETIMNENWQSISDKFKQELRMIIRSTIYSRLPNLRPLLLDETVTVRNIKTKLTMIIDGSDDDDGDDDVHDDDNNNDSNNLYAKNEKELIKLIIHDKNYYKKYKKSVLSKEGKIIKEIFKLVSIEKDSSKDCKDDDKDI